MLGSCLWQQATQNADGYWSSAVNIPGGPSGDEYNSVETSHSQGIN